MNECLLCERITMSKPSWKELVGIEIQPVICRECSKKFVRAEIIDRQSIVDEITCIYSYNEAMRNYLHQYKFLQDVILATVFSTELRQHLKGKLNVVPIPIHPQKKIERTFSHVDELLNYAGIPFFDILEKNNTTVMAEKTKIQRLEMQPLFSLKAGVVVKQESYTLVDDIYTTGTTVQHAATLLKSAGATKVDVVTLIRA